MTACPGCAAIRNAERLFEMVEAFAIENDIESDAMQAALTELLALWVAINTEYRHAEGDIAAPVDGVLIASINEYAAAIRHRASTMPVSAEFTAASVQTRHNH